MLTLLKLELEKLFRARSFYLSFVVLSAFVALMLWGFYTYAARKTGGQAVEQFKYTYESKQYFNGLTFALYSVLFSFTLLLPIFVSMSAGSQIASESRSGTLRMICTRPISRASLILSKFLVTGFHAALLLTFFIVLNLVVGLIFIGWGNLELYPGPLNLVDAPGKILRDEALMRHRSREPIQVPGAPAWHPALQVVRLLFGPPRQWCRGGGKTGGRSIAP